ncbi:MAG: FxsA family protein [Anaerolineae bacterium]
MLSRLLLLFIIVPAIELILLIQMGQWIGTLPTVGLIVVTGIIGAYLTRQQGVQVWRRVQQEMQTGQIPGGALLEGAMILIAGAVLMTPGVLTDALGFLLLIPPSRKLLSGLIGRQFQRMMERGQIRVGGFGPMGPMGMGNMGRDMAGAEDLGPHVTIIDPDEIASGKYPTDFSNEQ